jgi:hypothetical protein
VSAELETVKLHMIINIRVDDPEADTGISLYVWNAMTSEARQLVADDMWRTYAQADDGGVSVVTPGAEEI